MHATSIRHYMDNHLARLAGIILTGWARYDHYVAICKLLPISILCCFHNIKILTLDFHQPAGRKSTCLDRFLLEF